MLNAIPFLGWFISLIVSTSLAVPFWACWTWGGLGKRYFYFLPDVFLSIPFWNCVGLFIIISVLKAVLWPGPIVQAGKK